MKKSQTEEENKIQKNLEYLELDLDNIPKAISEFEPLDYRISKSYEDNKYRQYRYIEIKDIEILLSPTNRLNDLEEKYSKASPIMTYLIPDTEENILKHTIFLKMLKDMKIYDIEEVEKEQKELNKKIPFKVKFPGNYLWQIYYSENTGKYFMLVPTEDSDYSTFFYLLKKKLKKRVTGKIFVPISNVEYSREFLNKTEFEDIENYLWLFTNDWPLVYEVYDKNDNLSIHIVGETEVYGKIKSPYKIKLSTKEDANKFYKLIKALFILQTELPHHFKFETNINQYGSLEFYREGDKVSYDNIAEFIKSEYINLLKKQEQSDEDIVKYKQKLEKLKKLSSDMELEYVQKEKQISLYLECKKTFFGKVKYFFKYGNKKTKGKHIKEEETIENEEKTEIIKKKEKVKEKEHYTLEELIKEYKKYELKELDIKNAIMDINALKLKNKNLKKKIENATLYIKEIDNHKKSIFEFWRYSNKDEVSSLPEGETEEVNEENIITKVFNYEDDIEEFGKNMDKLQRKELNKDELDSIYITSTDVFDLLTDVRNGKTTPKEIGLSLKRLKEEAQKEKTLLETEEFDIFGGMSTDNRKLKTIGNQKHRELPRDKFEILEINKSTKQLGYKLTLERINEKIGTAIEKVHLEEDITIYIASDTKINKNEINIGNLNPEYEIKDAVEKYNNKIEFYKINLKKGVNAIAYTNIIFYDNKNKTLPIGMNMSTKLLIDLSKLELIEKEKSTFKVVCLEDENNELSKNIIKTVNVTEFNIKE